MPGSSGPGYFCGRSQLWWQHGEAGVDLCVDVLPLGFEVEGGGGGVLGVAATMERMRPPGPACGEGLGGLRADVGEFDQGGQGGAQGFRVLAGALDGFPYGLLAGSPVGG